MRHTRSAAGIGAACESLIERWIVQRPFDNVDVFPELMDLGAGGASIGTRVEPRSRARPSCCSATGWSRN